MVMKSGDRWHCIDPSCRSELSVGTSHEIPGEIPHCACGALMKKHYTPPEFSYLGFLQDDRGPRCEEKPAFAQHGPGED